MSILVVDGDDRVRATLILLLEHHGYSVTGAAIVTETLHTINEDVCDLILTDLEKELVEWNPN